MPITTLAELNSTYLKLEIQKNRPNVNIGNLTLWNAGGYPEAQAAAGSLDGVVYDSSSGCHLPPGTGGEYYITSAMVSHSIPTIFCNIILFDRLWGNSGLSGTQTANTSLGSVPDLTRPNASGENTELWFEVYSNLGSTNRTLSVVYTNSVGQTGRVATFTTDATPLAGYIARMKLQTGDTGVSKCTSYSWDASTGTAGNFGLVIQRRIIELPINGEQRQLSSSERFLTGGHSIANFDFAKLGLPEFYDTACIYPIWYGAAVGASLIRTITVTCNLVQK